MNTLTEKVIEKVPFTTFTDTVLRDLIPGTDDRRYGLVKRALKEGELIRLKRGLYALDEKWRRQPVNLYEAAQKIYGPSYVSLETALSHHGWIPEAVYTITSVCFKRSKEFDTPLGRFNYVHIPSHDFFSGVRRVSSPNGIFFMATPWRALADYVYVHRKKWNGLKPVVEDLRVDPSQLQSADADLLKEIEQASRSSRVKNFIEGIRKELSL